MHIIPSRRKASFTNVCRIYNVTLRNTLNIEKIFITKNQLLFCAVNIEFTELQKLSVFIFSLKINLILFITVRGYRGYALYKSLVMKQIQEHLYIWISLRVLIPLKLFQKDYQIHVYIQHKYHWVFQPVWSVLKIAVFLFRILE